MRLKFLKFDTLEWDRCETVISSERRDGGDRASVHILCQPRRYLIKSGTFTRFSFLGNLALGFAIVLIDKEFLVNMNRK